LAALEEALAGIGEVLRPRRRRHVVAVVSTVLPGDMAALRSGFERAAGGRHALCYCPAFVALGAAVDGFARPDLVLIGEPDRAAGGVVARFHRRLSGGHGRVVRTDLATAEVAKLALNTFVCTKISFANFITRLCEALPGADGQTVLETLGADPRVGE